MTIHIHLVDDSAWVGQTAGIILELVATITQAPSRAITAHVLSNADLVLLCSDETKTWIPWLYQIRHSGRYCGHCWILQTRNVSDFKLGPEARLFSGRMGWFHDRLSIHELAKIAKKTGNWLAFGSKMNDTEFSLAQFEIRWLNFKLNHH